MPAKTNKTDDLFSDWEEVQAAQGRFAKWESVGDSVTGTVELWDAATGATTFDGDPCGFLQLVDSDGEQVVVSLDKPQLRDMVVAAKPKPGDMVRVKFDEMRTSLKSGREYKAFSVAIRRQQNADPGPKSFNDSF